MITRRKALAALAAAGALSFAPLGARTEPRALPLAPLRADKPVTHDITLTAAPREMRLLGDNGPSSQLWTYADKLFPVHRIRHGDRLRATLVNNLAEHTSIHWHGMRVPNAMDGVQYVTQKPVEPGEHFIYDFTPPDTGTFFFHPHCNESGQVGHGLVGVVIVEGDESEAYDREFVLVAKDWRLKPDGSFLPFETDAGAARAGTFGTIRTVNAQRQFTARVPASADIRMRLLNLDATRAMEVGVEGGPGAIIAIDGNPLPPLTLDTWRIGAAGRVDLLVRTPVAGQRLKLVDYNAAQPFILAELTSEGSPRRSKPFAPAPLYASSVPVPDLGTAESQSYVFGAASDSIANFVETMDPNDPVAQIILDELCTGSRTFWAINKLSWPNDGHRNLPPPLASLNAGRSYRFTLQNVTPHPHPIHLHGHTFTVLGSSKRDLPVHQADTVLLLPKERIDIAFVATPGKWMFHCHILEHLETGMMGYFAVA
jgi:FtsP/CotA-like multicopper oxidase with cupredoxin domain